MIRRAVVLALLIASSSANSGEIWRRGRKRIMGYRRRGIDADTALTGSSPDARSVEQLFLKQACGNSRMMAADEISITRCAWRPIETAPMASGPCESEPVLTFDSGDIDVAHNYRGTWYGRHGEFKPTHWMPLPEAPK